MLARHPSRLAEFPPSTEDRKTPASCCLKQPREDGLEGSRSVLIYVPTVTQLEPVVDRGQCMAGDKVVVHDDGIIGIKPAEKDGMAPSACSDI